MSSAVPDPTSECAIKDCPDPTVQGPVSHFCARHRAAGERQLKVIQEHERRAEIAINNLAAFARELPEMVDCTRQIPEAAWNLLAGLIQEWDEANAAGLASIERSGRLS